MPRRHLESVGIAGHGVAAVAQDLQNRRGYPRPMLWRQGWTSLDGRWKFALDPDAHFRDPESVPFERTIEVPFSPETARSGIGDGGLYRSCWYERSFEAPALSRDERLLLHFGAVEYECSVWLEGRLLGHHEGGYTPFEFDVTDLCRRGGPRRLVVRAQDDPHDLCKPRGKQDWQLLPHSVWYPRTTGIWQTVWLERAPARRVASLLWTPNLDRWEIGLEASVLAPPRERVWLHVRLHARDILLAEDRYAVVAGEVHRRLALSDPGIDDFRNELLWSPSSPNLIDAEIELVGSGDEVLDRVRSYTALRSFAVDGDRLALNGRPYPLRMVLDQGYWPETGLTAPDDEALRRDVQLAKAMGFNAVRKHQKVEDPRYLYWADVLGLLVSEEMPSAYRFTRATVRRLLREWTEVIERDASHPCVVLWVPFNESWGVPNLPANKPERHYVEALYHVTKTLDPTRPVIGNDGWESVATDVVGIHDYDPSPERMSARYATHELLPRILKRERPGGRAIVLEPQSPALQGAPLLLSEFGGIALFREGSPAWGYSVATSPRDFASRYARLLEAVRGLEVFAGFCYTQFSDTYQEANGLLYADRSPKIPLAEIAIATGGGAGSAAGEVVVTERTGAPQ